MKFIFNTNGNILESENTESIIQFSVNANEIYMTFARMPMAEYIGYISFERADGKTSPLIGMQYCSFPSPSGEPMIGFKYSFSDAWVTAIAGILKVVFTLKRNGIVIKTATINLNVIESIAEDEVNYIDDVAYNELLSRMQSFEITAENLSATNLIQEQKIKDLASKLNSTIIPNNVGSIQSKSITNEINTLITKGVYLLQQIQYDEGSISHPITALMFVKEITSGIWMQTILFEFGDRINYLTRTIDSRTGNININISERKIITHADDIPTRLGQLENDMHFALQSSVPTKLSQLQDDSDFVNTSELKEYVNSKSPKNIGELESDPENKNNIVLNYLNEDGIYHFTYQGVNGIIFVKKIPTTVDGDYDIVQSILYNPRENGYESSLLRRLISVANNTIVNVDIFNMGTLATTQEFLNYLQHEYLTKVEIEELLSLIPKFNIEVVQELPTSEISDTTVYLISSGDEDNLYTEYIYVNGKWEILGIQAVDLTGYAKLSDIPTKTSQLQNDSGFLNQHQDLSDYATKEFVTDALKDFDFTDDYETLKNRPVINLGGILRNEERIDSADCPTLNNLFVNKYGGYFYTFDYIEYKHIMFIDRINPQTQTILQFAEGKINVIRRVKAEDGTITVTTDTLTTKNDIPTKLSHLQNDINITASDTAIKDLGAINEQVWDVNASQLNSIKDSNFLYIFKDSVGCKCLMFVSPTNPKRQYILRGASYDYINFICRQIDSNGTVTITKNTNLATQSDIPTRTSQLENDSKYVTSTQLNERKFATQSLVSNLESKVDTNETDAENKITQINKELENIKKVLTSNDVDFDTLQELVDALKNNVSGVQDLFIELSKKANKNELPTKVSELENNSNYVTLGYLQQDYYNRVTIQTNYYPKNELYSKTEIDAIIQPLLNRIVALEKKVNELTPFSGSVEGNTLILSSGNVENNILTISGGSVENGTLTI